MLRNTVILILLLPGLVVAAPIAGPCGRCGDGELCPMAKMEKPSIEAHACCGETSAETPVASPLGFSVCDCGRDAPPAVMGGQVPGVEISAKAFAVAVVFAFEFGGDPFDGIAARSSAPPPPFPPVFLIDCVFLT